MQTIVVDIYRSWNEAAWRTESERPAGSAAALLSWVNEPPAVDGGVPVDVARVVAQVCAAFGPVAFRLFFDHRLSREAVVIPAPRKWFALRLWRKMTRTWESDIAIATRATDIAEMFDQDWSLQGQTALILEGLNDIDEPIGLLRRLRDWRSHPLPAGARFLVAAAVDGDGIMFAAKGEDQLDTFLSKLEDSYRHQHIQVRHPT